MKLLVTKRAEAQLLTTFDWLEENVGGDARQKLESEVEHAFTALKATLFIGPEARDVRTKGVHRL